MVNDVLFGHDPWVPRVLLSVSRPTWGGVSHLTLTESVWVDFSRLVVTLTRPLLSDDIGNSKSQQTMCLNNVLVDGLCVSLYLFFRLIIHVINRE